MIAIYLCPMTHSPVLQFTDRGPYCPAGDFYIDPWRPVDRAVITHAHADHARPGHARYLATHDAGPVLRHRLGDIILDTAGYGEVRQIGGARVSFHPAGHVPGSAQVRVEVAGQVWVVSGDYKTEADGLCPPFVPVPCHSFVTECTFGLPAFRWQPQSQVAEQINAWWAGNAAAGRHSLLGVYSLGKAQRILSLLDPATGPILTHAAVENTTMVLRDQGLHLPATQLVDKNSAPPLGAIVLMPPAAIGSTWAKRFGRAATASASGWMRLRGMRRRRGVDQGFIISDHADWDGLNRAIDATGAENIYTTHGYTDIFTRWLADQGFNAQQVPTELGQSEISEESGD